MAKKKTVDGAFVFSADWHVCRSAWRSPRVVGDSYCALRAVVDLCTARKLPLLAGGDLFDSPRPSPEDCAVVRRQMRRMQVARLPVYFIQGQHELVVDPVTGERRQPWLSAVSPWPKHLNGRVAVDEELGFRVAGLDYQPPSKLAAALDDLGTSFDFLLCHQVWQDLMGGRGGQCDGTFSSLPGAYGVLTGDFHKTVAGRPFSDHSRAAYSPGALHRLSIDEPDEHGVFVFNRDGSVDFADVPTRPAHRYRVETAAELDELVTHTLPIRADDDLSRLPDELRKPLVRVRYSDDLPTAADRLAAACAGRFHLFASPFSAEADEAASCDAAERVEDLRARGAAACLESLDLSRFGGDPAVLRADAERLLRADAEGRDVRDEVAAMWSEAVS